MQKPFYGKCHGMWVVVRRGMKRGNPNTTFVHWVQVNLSSRSYLFVNCLKVARFKRQRAAELKLQDIKERKERRRRSMQAAAKATVVEHGEEDLPDEDDEEEREVNGAIQIYL
jgi:hypothetical protein